MIMYDWRNLDAFIQKGICTAGRIVYFAAYLMVKDLKVLGKYKPDLIWHT